jgi:hypothetical protein
MQKGRFLYEQKLKEHPEIGVYGIFDTRKVSWSYYVISFENAVSGGIRLSPEICGYSSSASYETVEKQGKKFNTKEEGIKFIQEYKIKWETGSNNTTEEIRDQKLDELLES